MKKVLLSVAVLAAMLTACKKDDDNDGGGGSGLNKNQWKVGGTTFTAINSNGVNIVGNSIAGSGLNGTTPSSFLVDFYNNLPTADGSYKIVNSPSSAMEVSVAGSTGAAVYISTDYSGKNATVTVTGGKITVTVPEIYGKSANGDSVKIEGNLSQP